MLKLITIFFNLSFINLNAEIESVFHLAAQGDVSMMSHLHRLFGEKRDAHQCQEMQVWPMAIGHSDDTTL